MTITELREIYNREVRQAEPNSYSKREIVGTVYRYRFDEVKAGAILYSRLDESNADAAIAEQIAYFKGLGYEFEWTHFDYDTPSDLKERLRAAGFAEEETEAVMVLPIANAPKKLLKPITHDIRRVTTIEGLKEADSIVEAVWNEGSDLVTQRILPVWELDPDAISLFIAYMDGKPVSYGRSDYPDGSSFVGMYGGSTLPEYRNRGIYTALVAARLQEAKARGKKYMWIDATQDTSMPIVEKLGFIRIGLATPFIMEAE